MLPTLDGWLAGLFEPSELDRTVAAMWQSQPDATVDPNAAEIARVVADCDTKLDRYRAALEAGYRPGIGRGVDGSGPDGARHGVEPGQGLARAAVTKQRLSKEEIRGVVDSLGSARRALLRADPADKSEVYRQLGLRLTYLPAERTMRADINIDAQSWGYGLCPRGDVHTNHTPSALRREVTAPRNMARRRTRNSRSQPLRRVLERYRNQRTCSTPSGSSTTPIGFIRASPTPARCTRCPRQSSTRCRSFVSTYVDTNAQAASSTSTDMP